MSSRTRLVLALAGILSAATSPAYWPAEAVAQEQDEELERPDPDAAPEDAVLGHIGELTTPDELETELRGARLATPGEWQASFYSTFDQGKPCTSSMVGYRVILTAAHCIQGGGRLHFEVDSRLFSATCERHPRYGSNNIPSADYALCLVDEPGPHLPYEHVNKDPSILEERPQLLLTGFGCVNADGTGGHDNHYRIGEADISQLPSLTGPELSQRRNSIRTDGEAAVCFGDSGGPAFLRTANGKRVVVSVNSVTRKLADGTLSTVSYLSSTSTPDALTFFTEWKAQVHQQEPAFSPTICGVDQDAGGCR